jgi:hypothetical protein
LAQVTREVGTDGQGSSVSYSYDDVSNLITQVTIVQSAPGKRQVTANAVDRTTGAVRYTATRNVNTGTTNLTAVGLNIQMIASVDRAGAASLVPPYNFQCQWGPAQ